MLQDYLKKYRMKHNLTQFQMAERLKTSQDYYSQLETGRKKPGHTMIARIAKEIGVSESYISRLTYENN